MIIAIYQALKAWIYAGASLSATKYFAAGQSIERGSKNTGEILISRSGTLRRTVIASVDSGMIPSSPSPDALVITATWGSATPYARIQEYGGHTGRNHASYIPPRPYLKPAQDDTREALITGIQAAVERSLV